ncbi:hypothetical protein AB6E02_16100 [Vibrio cyclitrophicus]
MRQIIVKLTFSVALLLLTTAISFILPKLLTVENFGLYVYIQNVSFLFSNTIGAGVIQYFLKDKSDNSSLNLWRHSSAVFFISSVLSILFLYFSKSYELGFLDLLIGAIAICLVSNFELKSKYSDKINKTTETESIKLMSKGLILSVIFVVFKIGDFNLTIYFEILIVVYLIATTLLLKVQKNDDHVEVSKYNLIDITRYQKFYIMPVLLGSYFVFLARDSIVTNEGLQELARFGLSYNISWMVVPIFSSLFSIVVSRLVKDKNDVTATEMFSRIYNSIFLFVAVYSIIIFQWIECLVLLLYKGKYQNIDIIVLLLSLYALFTVVNTILQAFYIRGNREGNYNRIMTVTYILSIFLMIINDYIKIVNINAINAALVLTVVSALRHTYLLYICNLKSIIIRNLAVLVILYLLSVFFTPITSTLLALSLLILSIMFMFRYQLSNSASKYFA